MKRIKLILNWFKKNKKRYFLFLIPIFLVGYLFYMKGKTTPKNQTQTAKVERGNLISTVSASGQVLSSNYVNVTTLASGFIKKVYVKDGDKVYSGQKLAEITLDSSGQQTSASAYNSYLSAKNSLDSAQVSIWTLDSAMFAANRKFMDDAVARNLATNDPTYIQEHDDWLAAEAKYKNQQNAINQAKISINNAWLAYRASAPIVYSPTSGDISNITIAEGLLLGSSSSSSTGTSQRIAIIKSDGTPLASFNLSEVDVAKIKVGQKASIKFDSLADKVFTGIVQTVDRIGAISSNVTNYPVIIKFDTSSVDILPNMAVTANIILDTKDNALIVPSTAIRTQSNQTGVLLVKNGKQEFTVVETGLVSDSQTEVTSGLSEGDEVVTLVTSTGTSQTNSSSGSLFGVRGFSGGGAGRIVEGR